MGEAKSLQGGVLLQTPLLGADGKVYAVAQGPVAVGGFIGGAGGAGGATVQKNHPTVGTITNGAIVEREIPAAFVRDGALRLLLHQPDFTSAARMESFRENQCDDSPTRPTQLQFMIETDFLPYWRANNGRLAS